MDPNLPSADKTYPFEDAGADTQRRYRHQAAYTAILALGLLEDDGPEEIYCEHHDGVILHLRTIESNLGFWNERKNSRKGARNGTPPPAPWINNIAKQGEVAPNFVSDMP